MVTVGSAEIRARMIQAMSLFNLTAIHPASWAGICHSRVVSGTCTPKGPPVIERTIQYDVLAPRPLPLCQLKSHTHHRSDADARLPQGGHLPLLHTACHAARRHHADDAAWPPPLSPATRRPSSSQSGRPWVQLCTNKNPGKLNDISIRCWAHVHGTRFVQLCVQSPIRSMVAVHSTAAHYRSHALTLGLALPWHMVHTTNLYFLRCLV
jgi:hypothetical protein